MRKINLIFLILLLTGCSLPTPATESPTFTPTFTPSPTPTPTPTSVPYEGCYWNWATQSLPDVSKQVQAEVDRAGLDGVSVAAEAYGENCIDPRTNLVDHFATMETDFRFTAKVRDLKDTEALGALLEKMLGVLGSFPKDTFPGPNMGYVGVLYQAGSQEQRLWFLYDTGKAALEQGLHGTELFEAVQRK